jgi:hypothetical protein
VLRLSAYRTRNTAPDAATGRKGEDRTVQHHRQPAAGARQHNDGQRAMRPTNSTAEGNGLPVQDRHAEEDRDGDSDAEPTTTTIQRDTLRVTRTMTDSLRTAQCAQRPQTMSWEEMRRLRRYETNQSRRPDEGLTSKLAGLLSTQMSKSSRDRRARSALARDRGGAPSAPAAPRSKISMLSLNDDAASSAEDMTGSDLSDNETDALGVTAHMARRRARLTNSYLAYLVFEAPTAKNLLEFINKQNWLPTTRFTTAVTIIGDGATPTEGRRRHERAREGAEEGTLRVQTTTSGTGDSTGNSSDDREGFRRERAPLQGKTQLKGS